MPRPPGAGKPPGAGGGPPGGVVTRRRRKEGVFRGFDWIFYMPRRRHIEPEVAVAADVVQDIVQYGILPFARS